jgi:hypothetical protein
MSNGTAGSGGMNNNAGSASAGQNSYANPSGNSYLNPPGGTNSTGAPAAGGVRH